MIHVLEVRISAGQKDGPRMQSMNGVIRDRLASGEYAKRIYETLKDHREAIRELRIKGIESNADVCQEFLFDVLTNFPRISKVFLPVNVRLGVKPLVTILDTIAQFQEAYPERDMELRLQLSSDAAICPTPSPPCGYPITPHKPCGTDKPCEQAWEEKRT